MLTFLEELYRRFQDYCDNSTIHGLHYLTKPDRNITERIFWAVACTLAGIGTYKLLQASWDNFQHNAVSFGVETTYLDWDTNFPSVSVCENESPDKVFESGTRLFGETRNMNLDFFLQDVAFFDGTCFSCKLHCNKTLNCTNDFFNLAEKVRAPCSKLLGNCYWNGERFNCCDHFLPLRTENGICFTLNSMHTMGKHKNEIDFKSNRKTGPGHLYFQAFESIKFLIHAVDDVPYINHPQQEKVKLNWGTIFEFVFQIYEIENDASLNEVSIEQRSCRFNEENDLKVYKYYSYSACIVQCRANAMLKFCNCIHHFVPHFDNAPICDVEGLICLTNHSEILRALRSDETDSDRKGLKCDCLSSCNEPEFIIVSTSIKSNTDYNDNDKYGSKISVILDSLPTQKFKRNVVRTRLDLVVSMGGTAGLFLGASLLSTFETIYFLILRKKTSIRSPTTKSYSIHSSRIDFSVSNCKSKTNINKPVILDKIKKVYLGERKAKSSSKKKINTNNSVADIKDIQLY